MAEEWTSATDGSQGVYPGEAGLVGTPNASGAWTMWIPRPGVTYSAQYWGRSLSIKNNGDGTYTLTQNGIVNLCRYAPRWIVGKFYDAAGAEVSSMSAAAAPGNPGQVYFERGLVESTQSTGGSAQITPVTVNQSGAQTSQGNTVTQQSGAPDPATTRTRSSDGRTDVYAGDSGMVGMFDTGRNAWFIFMPNPGVDYVSFYWNGDIAIRNNGDGTYWLDADGVKAKRLYSQRWQPGKYYDRNGREVASPSQATAQQDPADIFFVPGQIAPDSAATTGQSQVTTTPQPMLPVTPVSPDPVYVGASITPNNPGNADFPTSPITSPDGGAGGGISKGVLIAAAVAAFALLK